MLFKAVLVGLGFAGTSLQASLGSASGTLLQPRNLLEPRGFTFSQVAQSYKTLESTFISYSEKIAGEDVTVEIAVESLHELKTQVTKVLPSLGTSCNCIATAEENVLYKASISVYVGSLQVILITLEARFSSYIDRFGSVVREISAAVKMTLDYGASAGIDVKKYLSGLNLNLSVFAKLNLSLGGFLSIGLGGEIEGDPHKSDADVPPQSREA